MAAMEIPNIVPQGKPSDVRKALESMPGNDKQGKVRAIKQKIQPPLDQDLKETMRELEALIAQFNRRFKISLDKNINRIIIKVIDTKTDKVIKEIPPEEIQHLLAHLKEMMGLLVDERI